MCPICRGELTAAQGGAALRCSAGHSYDAARSGYVNLLRPGIKSNARSGDPEDMVKARRAFLSRGHYDRYVREAAALLRRTLGAAPALLVDAACGEGHHTLILADELSPKLTVGIDAAKGAVDLAQKKANAARRAASGGDGSSGGETANSKGAEVRFVAGNIFDMPLADLCADAVSVLFAPIPSGEARRVLREHGVLLVCSAGREHLIELRRAVYDEVRFKDEKPLEAEGFELAARENVTYAVDLDGDALRELFAMTPFCRRVGEAARERIAASSGSTMTVSVDCAIYRKV